MAKEWNWSYSKLKNYETCPRRYYEIDVQKNWQEPKEAGGPLDWGDKVHKAVASALAGCSPVDENNIVVGEPGQLPPMMRGYQHWVEEFKTKPGTMLIEQKYAITKQFQASPYFGNEVWYRSIGDLVHVNAPVAAIRDWKTGAVKEDPVQLLLMAQCVFSFYPMVQVVKAEFIWLQENCRSTEIVDRKRMALEWVAILDRVNELKEASDAQKFPPKPGALCKKWCSVQSCPHWKKGAF